MKKLISFLIISVLFISCGLFKTLDLSKLRTGMTKEQVVEAVGDPSRILAVNNTQNGYQEVLEYRTPRNEVYALEFIDDYLVGYEFLYEDVEYIAPAPPMILPDYGRPIYIDRPSRPSRPNRPSRPETDRPGNSSSGRPSRPGETTRPGNSSSGRPGTPNEPTRPERPSNERPSNERPAAKPNESSRPSTSTSGRPTNTNDKSSGRSAEKKTEESSSSSATRER